MKRLLFAVALLWASVLHAQDPFQLFRMGDSLYRAKNFRASAQATLSGIAADAVKDNPVRYLYAAGAYAQAGLPDSAFKALEQVTVSRIVSSFAVKNLKSNKDLSVLHTDPRWNPFMEKVTRRANENYKITEMIYGHKEGVALSMLNLAPVGKSNGLGIIRVVAGSWYSSLSSAENYVMSSYDYLRDGFRVFHVMVGSNPRYNIPEQIDDIKRAVRYIRYHAASLGINPNAIGIEGGSAGGHLSLAVALAPDSLNEKAEDPVDRLSARVQAVAVLYPPVDFLNWGGRGMNMSSARGLLEFNKVWGAMDFRTLNENNMTYVAVTDTAARTAIARRISPVYEVSADDPPVFFMHGDADQTVPLQQSQLLLEALKAAGVKHRFVMKPGGRHNPQDMLPEWRDASAWFIQHLKP